MAFRFLLIAGMSTYLLLRARKRMRRRGRGRDVIHPEGFVGARRVADAYLNGAESRFKDLFRMDRATFQALLR